MVQKTVMKLHLVRYLHDSHAPFSEKCHSLVTEWALGQCVYHFEGTPYLRLTMTNATGPGKDTDPCWAYHLLSPLEIQTGESNPSLPKLGIRKLRVVEYHFPFASRNKMGSNLQKEAT